MRLKVAQIVAVTAVLAVCGTAVAYILPGDFIVGKVAEQRANQGFSELTAEGAVTLLAPEGYVTGEGRLHYRADCCLELRVVSGSSEHLLVLKDGRVESSSPSLTALREALSGNETALLDALPGRVSSTRLFETCRRLGVEYEKRSLGRFHGRVAFVLGAASKEKKSPQLWVDKDAFQVLRTITAAGLQGQSLEIKLIDYQASPMPGRYPRHLEINNGRQLLFRMETDKVYSGLPPEEEEEKAAAQSQQSKPEATLKEVQKKKP